jgi:hypothetical protein
MFQALNHEFFYDEARFCSARWPWRVCKNVPVWHLHAQVVPKRDVIYSYSGSFSANQGRLKLSWCPFTFYG